MLCLASSLARWFCLGLYGTGGNLGWQLAQPHGEVLQVTAPDDRQGNFTSRSGHGHEVPELSPIVHGCSVSRSTTG